MGKRTTRQKQTPKEEAPPQPVQIPARPADIAIRAISRDVSLWQIVTDGGMQTSNITLEVEQVQGMVDGMAEWLAIDRTEPDPATVTEEPTGAPDPMARLVGPTGETLVK